MSTALPNEVYLVVFGHVNATPSLAAVCRVSKYFHALCTPILYRDVYVQHITLRVLRILSQLPVKSRLCYTRHLTLGRYMQISENESAETTHAVFVMLAKMQGLRSIEISVELSNCIASATYSAKKRFGDAPDLPAMLVERCPRLRHASFHPWLYDTKVPRFRNLRTLNIAHIPDYSPTLIGDLARVLVACPELESLGLSTFCENSPHHRAHLAQLVAAYEEEAREHGLPALRIRDLSLGWGFLPTLLDDGVFANDPDYLSRMLDLTALQSLEIDNSPVAWSHGLEIQAALMMPCLAKATNITRFVVAILTEDMADHLLLVLDKNYALRELFVREALMHSVSSPARILRYIQNRTRTPMRSLCLGGTPDLPRNTQQSVAELVEAIADAFPDLEELMVPATEASFQVLRAYALPRLPRLKALFISGGLIASLVPDWPWRHSNRITSVTPSQQRRIMADYARNNQINEETRLQHAKVFFKLFRLYHAADDHHGSLHYIAFYVHVYTCSLISVAAAAADDCAPDVFSVEVAQPSGHTILQHYRIYKLSMNEALSIPAIRSMYNDDRRLSVQDSWKVELFRWLPDMT